MKTYYIYILSSFKNGTLYVGLTSDLEQRVYEHKNQLYKGFTSRYDVTKLVYYEDYNYVYDAINRERSLKAWKRQWKIKLSESFNPEWKDLYYELIN